MALPLLNGNTATSSMVGPFKTIGDYSLVEFVGRGGMGEVWLGFKRGTTGPRAIKILLPELAKKITNVEAFRREADIGMQLSINPTIVGVQDIQEAFIGDPACPERVLYLVLDFVDGVNLRRLAERYHRVNGVRLPIPIVVHITRWVLRALAAAHDHKIGKDGLPVVHGDINPGNVLISSRGHVRVTDFGISRFVPEPTFISRPIGTLPYMAPEQYDGRICPQNDLYSVGAMLHELLTGEPPLPARGSPRTLERRLREDPVPPVGRDDVPAGLEQLRRGLLEKNATLRIQSAAIGLKILEDVDKTDSHDDLHGIYVRLFGQPRSRLTLYMSAQGDGTGSSVIDLLRDRRPASASGAKVEPRPWHDDEGEDDEEPMAWLVEQEDELTTEVHPRPAGKLSQTIRLDLPVGTLPPFGAASTPTVPEPPPAANAAPKKVTKLEPRVEASEVLAPEPPAADSDPLHAAGPLLEPADDEADLVTTAPRGAARKPATEPGAPTGDLRRYPPRPSHLGDGVPFQLRRPNREAKEAHVPVDASKPEPASTPSPSSADAVTRPDTGPEQTGQQRAPDTRPDAPTKEPATKISRRSTDFTTRWLRMAFFTVAATLILALGIGAIALAFAEPPPANASSDHPHPALAATTGN